MPIRKPKVMFISKSLLLGDEHGHLIQMLSYDSKPNVRIIRKVNAQAAIEICHKEPQPKYHGQLLTFAVLFLFSIHFAQGALQ